MKMKKKSAGRSRKFKFGAASGIFTVIFIAGILLVNVILSVVTATFPIKLDLTQEKLFEVGQESREYIGKLSEDIKINIFTPENKFNQTILGILKKYDQLSDKISLQYLDLTLNPTLSQKYKTGSSKVDTSSIVIESGKRFKTINYNDLFQMSSDGKEVTGLKAEQKLTSALMYVTSTEIPKMLTTTGHDEMSATALSSLLADNNYETGEINLLTADIPEDVKMMVIYAPARDFTTAEINKLDAYMTRGNNSCMVFKAPTGVKTPVLDGYMAEWGLAVASDVVIDQKNAYNAPIYPVAKYAAHDITKGLSNKSFVVLPGTSSVELLFEAKNNFTTFPLLTSYDTAYAKTIAPDTKIDDLNKVAGDKAGPFSLGAGSQKLVDGTNKVVYSYMFAFGSTDIASEAALGIPTFANGDFYASLVNFVRGEKDLVNISPKYFEDTSLNITSEADKMFILIAFVIVIPIALIAAGIFIFVRRRHL